MSKLTFLRARQSLLVNQGLCAFLDQCLGLIVRLYFYAVLDDDAYVRFCGVHGHRGRCLRFNSIMRISETFASVCVVKLF